MSYQFECRPDAVLVTEIGVTNLMDPGTGQKVGDSPGSTITRLAASMALFTDKVKPKFLPAAAKQNATKGWDLTLKVDRKDAAFQSLPKAKSMSLMTTGWTGLVELGDQDRKVFRSFVDGCGQN